LLSLYYHNKNSTSNEILYQIKKPPIPGGGIYIVGSLSLVLPALAASVRLSDFLLGRGGVMLGPVVGATEFDAGE
jgi:hypothetical protein